MDCLLKCKEIKESKYKRLQYIESTGTQYIDTNVLYNVNDIKFEIEASSTINGNAGMLIGISNTAAYYLGSSNETDFIWYSNAVKYQTTNNEVYNKKIKWTFDKGTLYRDNISVGVATEVYSQNIYINAYNNASSNLRGNYKIYSFKLWDNHNILVRDFIPVKRKLDNVICLYDKVEQKFYENNGSGNFIGA